jgi:ribosome-associated protein
VEKDLHIKNGITIPSNELEITASRAGGPGGQHVNKSSTRITIRWNVPKSSALTPEQKTRLLTNLQSQLTSEGDLIIHNSASRSQAQNKEMALSRLAQLIRKGLYVPKKRIATETPEARKEERLAQKTQRSRIKKLRSRKFEDE